MLHPITFIRQLRDREEGQGLVEYALILLLCSLVGAAALTPLGTAIATTLGKVTTQLSGT